MTELEIEMSIRKLDDVYKPEAARLGVRVEDMTEAQKQQAFVHYFDKKRKQMINRDGVNMAKK